MNGEREREVLLSDELRSIVSVNGGVCQTRFLLLSSATIATGPSCASFVQTRETEPPGLNIRGLRWIFLSFEMKVVFVLRLDTGKRE